jgi:hypothetical protein
MKQPFLRDCPWSLDTSLRDLSGFFYAMIERVDVPAGVGCPHARIRVGLSAISERSAMAVKGLTVAAHDAMTRVRARRRAKRSGAGGRGGAVQRKASHEQED